MANEEKDQKNIDKIGKGVTKTIKTAVHSGFRASTKAFSESSKSLSKTVKVSTKLGEKGFEKIAKTQIRLPGFFKKRRSILDFFTYSKRGIITGAADNDPSGIVTYTQVGAQTGTSLLWLLIISTPMLVAVEEMSARVGVVTRKGLNRVITERFGKLAGNLTAGTVALCNTLTIGANLAGMAAVLNFFTFLGEQKITAILAILLGLGFIFGDYKKISRFLFLLSPILIAYMISALLLNPQWNQIVKGTLVPEMKFSIIYIVAALGLLGTTIAPYLIFWQGTQEIEEKKDTPQLRQETKGVWAGMIYSNLIIYFVIVAAALVLFNRTIQSPLEAALALRPFGNLSFILFTIGLVGSGFLAIPVLAASTAYTLSDTYRWKVGFDQSQRKAPEFYGILFLGMFIAVAISLYTQNVILMLYYSQVLNGILMPILLFFLIRLSNDKKVLGNYTNSFFSNFWGVLAFFLFLTLIGLLFWQLISK